MLQNIGLEFIQYFISTVYSSKVYFDVTYCNDAIEYGQMQDKT